MSVDLTAVASTVMGALVPIGLIGVAVLSVAVGINVFRWLRIGLKEGRWDSYGEGDAVDGDGEPMDQCVDCGNWYLENELDYNMDAINGVCAECFQYAKVAQQE